MLMTLSKDTPFYPLITNLFGTDRRNKPYKALRRRVCEEPFLFQYEEVSILEYRFHFNGFTVTYDQDKRHFFHSDLFPLQYEQFSAYKGDMPNGVVISDKSSDVLRKLGKPFESGRTRRGLPVPANTTDQEWKAFLERQSAEPLTTEWFVFRVEDFELRFWFDDDLEGQMTSVGLSRETLSQEETAKEVDRLVKEFREST
ncbi:MAG: hypothetical protein C0469_16280 [Cyanobacteria bacterium DS2.3.42]|nr:hypothetical protein [Cyanobacteria bacterium DS2.3.42]